jgi:plastocyanin
MRTFVSGVLVTVLAGLGVAALVVWSGAVDISASRRTELLDRILDYASTRAIERHAPKEKNPLGSDPSVLGRGRDHYKEMCADCHGGPSRRAEEFAKGLHPSAPDLAKRGTQALSDGMLYWIISEGIHSTGMPAFGSTHRPEQIWSIVAYVRHLPEEKRRREPERTVADGGVGLEVVISGMKFDPPKLEVQAGTEVTWTNEDFVEHTATADDGRTFDMGPIEANGSKRVRLTEKGTFPYHCRYHSTMSGVLIVR